MQLIVVRRYDQPDRFGLHSNKRGAKHARTGGDIFDAVGLFSSIDIQEKLKDYGPLEESTLDLDTLITCAPIEWHTAMKQGEMLERFEVYTVADS